MKKKIAIVVCIMIGVIFIAVIGRILYINLKPGKIGTFSYEDLEIYYAEDMDKIKINEEIYLGKIENAQDAKQKVEAFLKERLGEEAYQKGKPYNVDYDQERKVWYVYGSTKENFWPNKVTLGWVTMVLVNEEDGKIIALWNG